MQSFRLLSARDQRKAIELTEQVITDEIDRRLGKLPVSDGNAGHLLDASLQTPIAIIHQRYKFGQS